MQEIFFLRFSHPAGVKFFSDLFRWFSLRFNHRYYLPALRADPSNYRLLPVKLESTFLQAHFIWKTPPPTLLQSLRWRTHVGDFADMSGK